MATTFKVLENGTPVLSMSKWSKPRDVYVPKHIIDEDDLSLLDWEDFKKKYPDVTKEEYDLMVKKFQEM